MLSDPEVFEDEEITFSDILFSGVVVYVAYLVFYWVKWYIKSNSLNNLAKTTL